MHSVLCQVVRPNILGARLGLEPSNHFRLEKPWEGSGRPQTSEGGLESGGKDSTVQTNELLLRAL